MEVKKTAIEGLLIIVPKVFGDKRGYFFESFSQREFDEKVAPILGHTINFVQDNESMSTYGVMRGLHFQRGEWSQAKLVRVSQGRVLDVAVDLRGDSPTFGKHFSIELSAELGNQFFIPRGFAHGFVVLSDVAQFQYKVDNVYAPHSEATLAFNDPTLNIDWLLPEAELLLSEKDLHGMSLDEITPF